MPGGGRNIIPTIQSGLRTVIRGKYIAVMWMYSIIILILHGNYTKSLELWNDNLIIKFDFLIGTDI
jgi:hypothetical protein